MTCPRIFEKTGYPPDLATREEFANHYKTRGVIRGEVEKYIHESMGIDNFFLPESWVYDRENLYYVIDILARQEIQRKWKEKFGALPPGLTMEDFFVQVGVEPLPPVEKIVMSENDFFKNIVLPQHKQMAVKMLDEIEAEKLLYANGQSLEEKGKDFVRALYIPIISLIVSLMVVMLTLMRGPEHRAFASAGTSAGENQEKFPVAEKFFCRYGNIGCSIFDFSDSTGS
jgi:hypothetical protein